MTSESLSAHTDLAQAQVSIVQNTGSPFPSAPETAKQYSRTKLRTGIASSVCSFIALIVFVAFGWSRDVASIALSISPNEYMAVIVFSVLAGLLGTCVSLPFGFYSGYIIEHRYGLSNQTLGRWAWERLKGSIIAAPLMIAVLLILYYCLNTYDKMWWLPVSIALTFFSVILARFAPIVIMPLFYKFTPISDGSLKERIRALCEKAGVRVEGIFSFNMSKNTRKANAAFTGIGKSKRIILGDTLLKEFTDEEIESVFAHELGHYTHRHIVVGMIISVFSTFVGLFLAAQLYTASLPWFGFAAITEIGALPLLALWLSVFGLVTSPLGNMLSRYHERQADTYAVKAAGSSRAFVSALQKLAKTNLADPAPHPLIEFLFYSHPSIAKRIKMVEALGT
ncbi:MAG: M48 family metallopeptidase [Bacteroidota bacterium]